MMLASRRSSQAWTGICVPLEQRSEAFPPRSRPSGFGVAGPVLLISYPCNRSHQKNEWACQGSSR